MLKAFAQGVISLLPASSTWSNLLKEHVCKSLVLRGDPFRLKVKQCARHLENYYSANGSGQGPLSVLELGTGWHPIVPVGFYICGVGGIRTIDITSLISQARLVDVFHKFREMNERGELKDVLPRFRHDRLERLESVLEGGKTASAAEMLRELDIEVLVGDARSMPLPESSIDMFVSNNTLEHIPEGILLEMLEEFQRLARREAVMSHAVDMSDHYSHWDSSITPYNYLRYSELMWRIMNNSLHYQNRLRIADYRRLHQAAGFRILSEENRCGSTEDLESIRLAKQFWNHTRDDLLVLFSWIVSTPAETADPSADFTNNPVLCEHHT